VQGEEAVVRRRRKMRRRRVFRRSSERREDIRIISGLRLVRPSCWFLAIFQDIPGDIRPLISVISMIIPAKVKTIFGQKVMICQFLV